MKLGKAPGPHGITAEMLKYGGEIVVDWMLWICKLAEGVNENGEHLVDICAERGLFLANTFLRHKMIHRYALRRRNDE